MQEILTALRTAMQLNARSVWLESPDGDIKVYCRRARRVHPKQQFLIQTLDIATVDIKHQRRGTFTRLLDATIILAKELKFDAVFVENVLNGHLAAHLDRRGDGIKDDYGDPLASPCFFFLTHANPPYAYDQNSLYDGPSSSPLSPPNPWR
jgi:hypothetical protein